MDIQKQYYIYYIIIYIIYIILGKKVLFEKTQISKLYFILSICEWGYSKYVHYNEGDGVWVRDIWQ